MRNCQSKNCPGWGGFSESERAPFEEKTAGPRADDLFAMFHMEHHAANAADLAEAMDARGYCEERAMTRLYPLRYTAADRRTYVCIAAYGSAMLALSLIL